MDTSSRAGVVDTEPPVAPELNVEAVRSNAGDQTTSPTSDRPREGQSTSDRTFDQTPASSAKDNNEAVAILPAMGDDESGAASGSGIKVFAAPSGIEGSRTPGQLCGIAVTPFVNHSSRIVVRSPAVEVKLIFSRA